MTFIFFIRAISKANEKLRGKHGMVFTSKRFKDFEAALRASYLSQKPRSFEGFGALPLEVSITCYFANKVHSDASNLSKSICDAFESRPKKGFNGMYKNDKQILALHTYVKYDVVERIVMVVEELNDRT